MPLSDKKIAQLDLDTYLSNNNWDHGNQILYEMIQRHFRHDKKEEVLTKVLFIGRIYAAAVERRKNKGEHENANFYIKKVWPAFQRMGLDEKIAKLKYSKLEDISAIKEALLLHGKMTKALCSLTAQNKRSFTSKYLHFHLPNIFFLYDTRANQGLKRFESPATNLFDQVFAEKMDIEYAKFFCRCVNLSRRINEQRGIVVTPRTLDNLLMYSKPG